MTKCPENMGLGQKERESKLLPVGNTAPTARQTQDGTGGRQPCSRTRGVRLRADRWSKGLAPWQSPLAEAGFMDKEALAAETKGQAQGPGALRLEPTPSVRTDSGLENTGLKTPDARGPRKCPTSEKEPLQSQILLRKQKRSSKACGCAGSELMGLESKHITYPVGFPLKDDTRTEPLLCHPRNTLGTNNILIKKRHHSGPKPLPSHLLLVAACPRVLPMTPILQLGFVLPGFEINRHGLIHSVPASTWLIFFNITCLKVTRSVARGCHHSPSLLCAIPPQGMQHGPATIPLPILLWMALYCLGDSVSVKCMSSGQSTWNFRCASLHFHERGTGALVAPHPCQLCHFLSF